jgi:hypothetical protein
MSHETCATRFSLLGSLLVHVQPDYYVIRQGGSLYIMCLIGRLLATHSSNSVWGPPSREKHFPYQIKKNKNEFPDKILSSHTFTTAPNNKEHESLSPSWNIKDAWESAHVLSHFGQRGYWLEHKHTTQQQPEVKTHSLNSNMCIKLV